MKNYLLDSKPNFGEVKCTLKDEKENEITYVLKRIKTNGCILTVTHQDGFVMDSVVFTMMDLKALFCLLTVHE
jgi:hypothetical protein